MRDTDADWRRIGEVEPHWGVLTDPRFKRAVLDAAAIETFYASGRSDVAGFVAAIVRACGRPPHGPALDFGCGVGRLTEAMAEIVEPVTGYDIAPGMLAQARARSGRAVYADTLPDGPFGWINSYIVFQHIAPVRGLAVLGELLRRLAPGGVVSLHFTCDHAGRSPGPAPDPRQAPSAAAASLRSRLRRRSGAEPPGEVGEVSMYDYDLTTVVRMLRDAGMGRLTLEPVDHGGHLGYVIVGARDGG